MNVFISPILCLPAIGCTSRPVSLCLPCDAILDGRDAPPLRQRKNTIEPRDRSPSAGTAVTASTSKWHGKPGMSPRGPEMLTMAILAIIGAFLFGFVLCCTFAVGAAADRSSRPRPDDGRDSLDVAILRAALDARSPRHAETHSPVLSSSPHLQSSFRPRRSVSSVRRDVPVARRREARGRPSSQA